MLNLAQKAKSIEAFYANNFTLLDIPMHAGGAKMYVAKSEAPVYAKLFANRDRSFAALYVFKQIASLKNIGGLTSLVSKYSNHSRKLVLQGGSITYAVWHGNIYIENVATDGGGYADVRKVPAGVYKATRSNSNSWTVADLDKLSEADFVNTKNLAINGACKSINEAADYMPAFIEYGHGESSLGNSYSLFFNPCYASTGDNFRSIRDSVGLFGSSQPAKKLAAVLERICDKKQPLQLTVNESGHALFKSALRDITKTGKKLDQVTVFYANPLNNLQAVDSLRIKAGMKLAKKPALVNSFSISQNITSGNIVSGAVVGARAEGQGGKHTSNALLTAISYASIPAAIKSLAGASALGTAGGAATLLPLLIGQRRDLNSKVITTVGESVSEGFTSYKKLMWDPVHKMMVKP